jgi:uncharacterized membrane protein
VALENGEEGQAPRSRTDQTAEDDERGRGSLGRLLAFSDGVFAIAITILVLDLDVPEGLTDAGLLSHLEGLVPQLLSAALSFAIIGRFWIAHHGLFDHVQTADGTLLVLGTVLLAPIVLIPFATELLAEYPDTAVAVMAYSVTVVMVAVAEWAILAYGTRHRVLGRARPATIRAELLNTAAATAAFLVAIPVALVSPAAAKVCWLLTVVPVGRLARHSRWGRPD